MRSEEETEIILWDWLKTKSQYVNEIYFNRINKLNSPIFTTKGINKKPDFIIKIDRGFGIEYIAIEIKNATSSKSVLDSGKILDYYENYYLGNTKYFIDNQEININHFAIATQNSINGFLFNTEKDIISNSKGSNDEWRITNAKYKLEPEFEYNETSRFQRSLWNEFNRLRSKLNIKEGASIGLILSEVFEDGSTNKIPYLFIMKYNIMKDRKSKWGARWWKI